MSHVRKPLPLEEELAKRLASDLAQGTGLEGYSSSPRANRSLRAALILRLYTGGRTLQEIGDLFGISRERVRQILNKAEGNREEGSPRRPNRSDKARPSMRALGKRRRMSGEAQRKPARNSEIERLANQGLSYAEIATAIGVSRSTVCAVMYRAKHRTDDLLEGNKYPPLPRWKGLGR